jgi:hypothetical protein
MIMKKGTSKVLLLTEEQKREILVSMREVTQGHFIEHAALDKGIRELLGINHKS